ncbi:MAG: hypothetical protein K1X66_08685 [Verrucomicrobiae bacterium]|nr:hypothetical protein [Verrucomicrobiae bacterium]
MKSILLSFFMLAFALSRAQETSKDIIPNEASYLEAYYLVILGNYRDFHEANRQAKNMSKISHTPFSLRNHIYDEKRGLILPDNDPDESYAGDYLLRRDNLDYETHQEYLSIEKSEAYPGLAQSHYIILAGIYKDRADAQKSLKYYQPITSKAYIKKTKIYMGCIH